jgi:plasmid stabilization system protein ParE
MRIRWTPAAAADLQHINDYLKDHHRQYRQPTMRKLYVAIQSLRDWRIVAAPDVRTEPARFCFRPCPMPPSNA